MQFACHPATMRANGCACSSGVTDLAFDPPESMTTMRLAPFSTEVSAMRLPSGEKAG
jgi:hypothetical protein